jgi:hypothetical protein
LALLVLVADLFCLLLYFFGNFIYRRNFAVSRNLLRCIIICSCSCSWAESVKIIFFKLDFLGRSFLFLRYVELQEKILDLVSLCKTNFTFADRWILNRLCDFFFFFLLVSHSLKILSMVNGDWSSRIVCCIRGKKI